MYNKQMQLVERLLAKTSNGEVDWQTTEDDGIYQVSFGDTSLRISEVASEEHPENDFVIAIFNQTGALVESFSDSDLTIEGDKPRKGQTWYRVMGELYRLARRTALGSEKILTDLLNRL